MNPLRTGVALARGEGIPLRGGPDGPSLAPIRLRRLLGREAPPFGRPIVVAGHPVEGLAVGCQLGLDLGGVDEVPGLERVGLDVEDLFDAVAVADVDLVAEG